MALTDAYFTKEEYYASVKKPLSTASEDAVVARGTIAVSRFLDKVSNKGPFGKDAAPVVRSVRASNDCYLDLRQSGMPGIATATGLIVTVNSIVLVVNTDFKLLPLNALTLAVPQPYDELELIGSTSRIGSFYDPSGFIDITATWGWPEVPGIVKETAVELLGIWLRQTPRATGRMNELDQVVEESPLAAQLINRFIRAIRGRPAVG